MIRHTEPPIEPTAQTRGGLRSVLRVGVGQLVGSNTQNVSRFYSIRPDAVSEFLGGPLRNFGYWTTASQTHQQAALDLVDRVAQLAAIHPGDGVLDAGCGYGVAAERFHSDYGAGQVVGVNVTPCQLEFARHHAQQLGVDASVQFVRASATKLPFPAQQFDHVIALESAFHFASRAAFLAEAFRVLRPGGRLTLADVVPLRGFAGAFSKFVAARLWLVPASNNYGPDEYLALLAATGFTSSTYVPIEERVYGGYVNWTLQPHNIVRLRRLLGHVPSQIYLWQTKILHRLWQRGLLGYGLIQGTKPSDSL